MTQPATAQAPPGAARTGHANPFVILAIVLAATFVQLVDISIVNTAIPSIQRDLGASYASVQLVIAGYTLAFAVTLITAARLGDSYGRRRLFLIGMAGFTVASALCGAAPNTNTLVVGRIVQGLFSGLMFPQVLSVIQVTFPPKDRGKAFGILGATIGLATILGPVLGGGLIQLNLFGTDWRMIFYVNVPIGVTAFVAGILRLGESTAPNAPGLDLPGALLSAAGLFLLVYPLTEGREKHWPAYLIVMLVAAGPVLALFVLYERRRTAGARTPLLQLSLFGNRSFRIGSLLSLVFFAGVPPFFFTFTLYIQIGLGFSALGAGLASFPFALGSAVAASNSDKLAKRWGSSILAVGTMILAVGMVLNIVVVHLAGEHPHGWYYAPTFFLCGIGLGLFIAPVINIILAGIGGREAGSASGVLSTVQQTGASIGIALIGVIFFGLLGANAPDASGGAVPALRQQLAAAGGQFGSPSAVATATDTFSRCYEAKARATDPTANPPPCPPQDRTGGTDPVARAFTAAALNANAINFRRTFEQTLGYEIGIFLLASLLVLALPRVRPEQVGHAGGEPAAAP